MGRQREWRALFLDLIAGGAIDDRDTSHTPPRCTTAIQKVLKLGVRRLQPRRRRILCHRYELNGRPFRTYDQLGMTFRISRARVGQILHAALRDLRRAHALSHLLPESERRPRETPPWTSWSTNGHQTFRQMGSVSAEDAARLLGVGVDNIHRLIERRILTGNKERTFVSMATVKKRAMSVGRELPHDVLSP